MGDRVEQAAVTIPAGFKLGPGGLLIPDGTQALERERWRHEDGMALVRAQRIARAHGLRLIIGCDDNRCAEDPQIREVTTAEHGVVWLCGHKERILTKGPTKKSPWRSR